MTTGRINQVDESPPLHRRGRGPRDQELDSLQIRTVKESVEVPPGMARNYPHITIPLDQTRRAEKPASETAEKWALHGHSMQTFPRESISHQVTAVNRNSVQRYKPLSNGKALPLCPQNVPSWTFAQHRSHTSTNTTVHQG